MVASGTLLRESLNFQVVGLRALISFRDSQCGAFILGYWGTLSLGLGVCLCVLRPLQVAVNWGLGGSRINVYIFREALWPIRNA